MHLHNLVDLPAEVVYDVQETALGADEDLADLASLPIATLRVLD